ncbi:MULTISPECIES: DM13 domain-containing protein [unclassified Photobacterium]|uniref:DM13 domain-containing protein n=1 Tax=unclassified Photobacterium TaxID=2628852 RepID=UPI001EE0E6FA|nr:MULTISPECIES: DM13 domain-containing protein [unclassified Photobacterium]MCG3865834.1 DM13 domain-containing protein [Photobacterium sp. Ph6]MCG3877309.1 DM13 domain-containing protein [Photobacterium sp. Ph5]
MIFQKTITLLITHLLAGTLGIALGIYLLPILTAPTAPTPSEVSHLSTQAQYSGEFRKDLAGSDFLHWGEGKVSISPTKITLMGKLAPDPDYKLYLSPRFVETETEFNQENTNMVLVGNVKTFNNFVVNVPQNIDIAKYDTVIVWCESFGQFITSAKYQ